MLKTNLTTLLVICGLLVSLNANVIEYHPLKPVDTNIEGWNNWTWASDAELLNFFLAVLPQDTDISVRSYRLVSKVSCFGPRDSQATLFSIFFIFF